MGKDIVVLGMGPLAKTILFDVGFWGWNLVGFVPRRPEPRWAEKASDFAKFIGCPILEEPIPCEVVVSAYYNKIIGLDIINNSEYVLNCHNAPLPKYRGMRPINFAMKNKETTHGVTIHLIQNLGVDTGPILQQAIFKIFPIDSVKTIYDRCTKIAGAIYPECIKNVDKLFPYPQDEDKATYYSIDDLGQIEDEIWPQVW